MNITGYPGYDEMVGIVMGGGCVACSPCTTPDGERGIVFNVYPPVHGAAYGPTAGLRAGHALALLMWQQKTASENLDVEFDWPLVG